jgi:hypothetical protein
VPVILRGNISDVDEWAGPVIEEYTTSDILNGLGITLDQFIDLCYVLGNDYCKGGLPGLGPKGALDAIRDRVTYPDMRTLWETHPLRPKPVVEVSIDQATREALMALVVDVDVSAVSRAVLLTQLIHAAVTMAAAATAATADSRDRFEVDGSVRGALLAALGDAAVRAAIVKFVAGPAQARDSSPSIKALLALMLAELAVEPATLVVLLGDDLEACAEMRRMQAGHEIPNYAPEIVEALTGLFRSLVVDAAATATAAETIATAPEEDDDNDEDDDAPLVARGPAPDLPKKRRAPAKPRVRKLKPGEVDKTPEELAAEATDKLDKLKKSLERKADARVTWNKFIGKYEWSKPLAFDTSKDHLYQLTHRDVRAYDQQALVIFFAGYDIDFLQVQPRKQWVEPAMYRASLDIAAAAGGGGKPASPVKKQQQLIDDNSPESLMAAALAQYSRAIGGK